MRLVCRIRCCGVLLDAEMRDVAAAGDIVLGT